MSGDSDDEVAAALMIIASSRMRVQRKVRQKRRWWSITLYRNRDQYGFDAVLRDLYMEKTSGRLQNFLRMSTTDFEYILNLVSPLIEKQDTHLRRAISAKIRLVITLRFLATGESFEDLSVPSRVSPQCISEIVIDVCLAIIAALGDQIRTPTTPQEWKAIAQAFEEKTFFRHCIGAIDGRHMCIQNPEHGGISWRNYKGTYSIVLMAMCDSNYCFTYANVGSQGRISDGGVFNACSLAGKLDRGELNLPPDEPLAEGRISVPYVIVADNAFALKKNMMVPYSGALSLARDSKERIFNYRLSAARCRIENSFGILSAVFRIFRKPMLINAEKARVIVQCGVILHNFLRRSRTSQNLYTPPGTFDTLNDRNGAWRADNTPLTSCLPIAQPARRSCQTAKEVREEFSKFYLSDSGKVAWQYNLQ